MYEAVHRANEELGRRLNLLQAERQDTELSATAEDVVKLAEAALMRAMNELEDCETMLLQAQVHSLRQQLQQAELEEARALQQQAQMEARALQQQAQIDEAFQAQLLQQQAQIDQAFQAQLEAFQQQCRLEAFRAEPGSPELLAEASEAKEEKEEEEQQQQRQGT